MQNLNEGKANWTKQTVKYNQFDGTWCEEW